MLVAEGLEMATIITPNASTSDVLEGAGTVGFYPKAEAWWASLPQARWSGLGYQTRDDAIAAIGDRLLQETEPGAGRALRR